MPIYRSSEQFYGCVEQLFTQIQTEYPAAVSDVAATGINFRFICSDPAAEIWIKGRPNPPQTSLGPSKGKSDLKVHLATDTLHNILLGQQSLTKALGAGKIKAQGPLWKAKALAALFHHSQVLYPKILAAHNLLE